MRLIGSSIEVGTLTDGGLALSPQAQAILLITAALRETLDGSLTTDNLAWSAESLRWTAPATGAKVPGRNVRSWLYRHRKAIGSEGTRHCDFSPNGYIRMSEQCKVDAMLLRAAPPPRPPRPCCPECGAQTADTSNAGHGIGDDRTLWACGGAAQATPLGWAVIMCCGSYDGAQHLADGEEPRKGIDVRRANWTGRGGAGHVQTRPILGRIILAAGSTCAILLADGRAILLPARRLIRASAPDPTALTRHQQGVLERLRTGSALLTCHEPATAAQTAAAGVMPEGLRVLSTPMAREGAIRAQPESVLHLFESGCLDVMIAAMASAAGK